MSEVITASVAAEVRAELARQRRPQRDLAEAIGLSQQAASRRLCGEVPFDIAELAKVAELLRVPIEQFLPERRTEQAGAA
jgi:transcriptional regulator with XRE-family HTH domain